LLANDTPGWAAYLREGDAMLAALAEDLLSLSGVDVSILRDFRLPLPGGLGGLDVHRVHAADQEGPLLRQLAGDADWTVLIAPELDGVLARRAALAEAGGARLLGPSRRQIQVLADKHAAAKALAKSGIATPRGVRLKPGERLPMSFTYPAVIKPVDGAGSVGVQYVESPRDTLADVRGVRRLERFSPGTPASVSGLCGPVHRLALMPCGQKIVRRQRRLSYEGGWLPLTPSLARRATRLASRALSALDCRYGYIGIDMVLGPSPDGTDDVVVEVNPRLTTSYLGLRAAARQNLADVMLELAAGHLPAVTFRREGLVYGSCGGVSETTDRRRAPAKAFRNSRSVRQPWA